MSTNKTIPKKTIREMEEELMSQQKAQAVEVSPFARGAEIAYKRSMQMPRQFHEATQADLERIRLMQQPQKMQPPPRIQGLVSATLIRGRNLEEARIKQAKFYSLLEEKYGAIRGNERSYLEAMERYHNDKFMKKQKSSSRNMYDKEEPEHVKRQKREQQERDEQYRRQAEYERQQRQQRQQQQSYSRPSYAEEVNSSSRIIDKYPVPQTREDALIIMGLNPISSYTQRDIKEAFNRKALQLHPDKNLDNPDEASAQFNQLHTAYKLLRKQAGGSRRKNMKYHRSINKRKSNKGKSSKGKSCKNKRVYRRYSTKKY